ncbi:hypothetical protein F2Q65_14695 [Thiohalocapsa marina]|uniref:SoxXA-binding protein n=1 Tax=Thiohalocapsa marina TaxID=424902 RepID=A0A5M8FG06_9GAMM|nr:hypothetical protein [Thiohalocapsa marina]KAA6183798.1 hypothetical protein F2Q65_14695 [Thiohalocapsa marina]
MKLNNLATRLVIAVLLIAVPVTAAWATTRQEAEDAIAEAKAMREKAAAAGVTDSQATEMIEEAEGLMPSRQYTRARMISYWAVRQDEFAMQALAGETAATDDKAALAEAMIASAEEARQKAASVGGEWRDIGSMIKSAQTLAGAGEFDQAIEAASAAKFQAERGYEQALAERNADFPAFMRKSAD